jgi:NNP family nitrate/nitrite transporter-like MFS transporter
LSRLTGGWPIILAVALVLVTSLFAQAGNGAVYAIVPLVKKRVSGQIAGMAGAYGNVGGIVFLTTLLFVPVQSVFAVMGVASLLACIAARWLVEPARSHEPAGHPAAAPAGTAAGTAAAAARLAPAGGA